MMNMMKSESKQKGKQQHFVLVHGACHGAWCWFKLKPLLEAAGHKVTALDMSASGINAEKIEQLGGFKDYNRPLIQFMASLPPQEKVVLVGHSLGGMNIAFAADEFPGHVSVAVFLAAFMPDTVHAPSYPLQKYGERTPAEAWLDTEFQALGLPEKVAATMKFGPRFLASKLYQLTSTQHLELAKLLLRPSSLFVERDLSEMKPLSEEGYGRVKRAYIKCMEDLGIPQDFQSWIIQNAGVSDVKEMEHTDHMAMISKPQYLCRILQQVVDDELLV